MNYTYDPEADALYVVISDAPCDHQMETDDGVIVDVALDGSLVGVDVMAPAAGWDAESIIDTYGLAEANADLLRHLAAMRSWTPLRKPLATGQTTGGHVERQLVAS